jgi:hypothetical protein
MTETLALAGRLHSLDYSTKADGAPHIESLSGNRNVLRTRAKGPVRGSFVGTISETVTIVHAVPAPQLQGIAISFTVETSQGSFSGHYTGSIQLGDQGGEYLINGYGQVVSVTGAYAELFLAEVFVNSKVPKGKGRSAGETGTLTLSPR